MTNPGSRVSPKRVMVAMGTRPEAIKRAPVAAALRALPGVEVQVVVSAQHRHMLDQVLDDADTIINAPSLLLDDPAFPESMARAHNPYGDGLAANRIATAVDDFCSGPPQKV